jgi:pimeloyl-ACP methyl ester carboxylesterase
MTFRMPRNGWTWLAAAAVAVGLGGCGLWRPTTVPLRTIALSGPCTGPVDTLVVMLPGSYSRPEDYQDEGFVDAARKEGLAVDWLLVDAHVGYYRERSIIDRLHDDVIAPARARGYRRVWLAGISIGAFGAMIYAESHPDDVDGMVAIAPYLGAQEMAEQISAEGGLRQWRAPAERPPPDDIDGRLWRWLQRAVGSDATGPGRPLFLGYGIDDRFAYSDGVLAAALPSDRVYTAPGGHAWPVWQVLWRHMLPALPLPREAGCTKR